MNHANLTISPLWKPLHHHLIDYPQFFATLQPHYHEKPLIWFRPYGVLFLNGLLFPKRNLLKKDFCFGWAEVVGLPDV